MSDLLELPYRPRDPKRRDAGIGLIGCGAITRSHLAAYRAAGFRVVAMCNPTLEKAEARRAEFYPDAAVFADHRALLAHPEVEVADVATHPGVRAPILADCLRAGKHALSQKPFVTDLDAGERLCDLADECGVRLAVNQNGRYAPHHAWMRLAVAAGLIGELREVEYDLRFDHSWVAGTAFDATEHLLLVDFGVHWFDAAAQLLGAHAAEHVTASAEHVPGQRPAQPLRARAEARFAGARARFFFDGAARDAPHDRSTVVGTAGRIVSEGPDLNTQVVRLERGGQTLRPALAGRWFDDGFRGTMAELLCAIEERREPANGARDNLRGLALAFAAAASSAAGGAPRVPGEVRAI